MGEVDPQILATLLERIDALGAISESEHWLTRSYLSPAMRQANDLVGKWMSEAGMQVREDPAGNVISTCGEGEERVIIGSHLDTVRNAGRYGRHSPRRAAGNRLRGTTRRLGRSTPLPTGDRGFC